MTSDRRNRASVEPKERLQKKPVHEKAVYWSFTGPFVYSSPSQAKEQHTSLDATEISHVLSDMQILPVNIVCTI